MDKNILLELKRMKEIMFFDKQNPDLILKEDSPSAERAIEMKNKEDLRKNTNPGHDPFADIPRFNIGKGTDYPFIFYFGDSKVDTLPVVQGSKIFKINSNTTSKNILGENVGIQVGTIVNEDGKEVSNQEYITKIFSEGNKQVEKKLCLPTKEFWQLPEIQGKVYRFSTPVRSKGRSFSVSGIEYFSKRLINQNSAELGIFYNKNKENLNKIFKDIELLEFINTRFNYLDLHLNKKLFNDLKNEIYLFNKYVLKNKKIIKK